MKKLFLPLLLCVQLQAAQVFNTVLPGNLTILPGKKLGVGNTNTPAGDVEIFNNSGTGGSVNLSKDTGTLRGSANFGRNNSGSYQVAARISGASTAGGNTNGQININVADSAGVLQNALGIFSDRIELDGNLLFVGPQSITTTTGDLTLGTGAVNGNIMLVPNGTGVTRSASGLFVTGAIPAALGSSSAIDWNSTGGRWFSFGVDNATAGTFSMLSQSANGSVTRTIASTTAAGALTFGVDTDVAILNTTAAVSSITGALRVGNGTAATTVGIGGGNGYFGGLLSSTDKGKFGGGKFITAAIDSFWNGSGVEIFFSNPNCIINAFDRGGAGSIPLIIGGSTISLAGNVSIDVAKTLSITSGANQRAGNLTLIGGTLTVNNTTVTANTIVLLTRKTAGGTIGFAVTYTVSAATSFTVSSDNALDTSTYSYLLIEVP